MITKYQDYLNKIKSLENDISSLRKELGKSKRELQQNIEEDLENEFEKYLKKVVVPKEQTNFFPRSFKGLLGFPHSLGKRKSFKIFLQEDDYGIMIFFDYKSKKLISIYSINKYGNKYSFTGKFWYFDIQPVDIIVKDVMNYLEINNIKRKKQKETIELKRMAKKYNL